ncbi:MAG TPA: hypothetical protein VFY65_11895, partial [Longimicrobium sp.]|nr:hypothetical protein [Longimicrobium sp.]
DRADSAVVIADSARRKAEDAQGKLSAQARQLEEQADSLNQVVAQMQAARQRADVSEQKAVVGAEAADYYLDISGRLLRRRVAEAAALDSTAGRTVARARIILDSARVLQGQSARMDVLVRSLCGAKAEDPRYPLRLALDSILGEPPLCGTGGQRSAAAQAGP